MSLSFRKALFWALMSGFLALAWEIVWARVFNFVSGSRAPVFGYMLASYLAGLAAGSLWSRRWQKADASEQDGAAVAKLVRRASIAAFLVAPVTAFVAVHGAWQWGYLLVALSGALLGVIFPLMCSWAVKADARAGSALSHLYLANIIGSGMGSLLTGFVFMEWLSLHQLSLGLLVISLFWAQSMTAKPKLKDWIAPAVVAVLTLPLFFSLYERLQYKGEFNGHMRFATIIEGRHGVITVDSSNAVYGNGAYDGVIDTKLAPGSWLVRPYFLSAVHPQLEEVLVIGVASGAWTQILADHPQVKKLTAVELSHGYLDLIAQRPEVSGILSHPKVELIIDDGRRWLRRHPERKFDAIVMNTTHHWREFAGALLSVEFLSQVKSHLKPGGIAYWNCTDSLRAAATGMAVFPHMLMVLNHCLASERPLTPDRAQWEAALRDYRVAGRPVFDLSQPDGQTQLNGVLDFIGRKDLPDPAEKWQWRTRGWMEQTYEGAKVITDDNLGHEYAP